MENEKKKTILEENHYNTLWNEVKQNYSHEISGIHRSPAVREKFHAGGAAGHDCEEKE